MSIESAGLKFRQAIEQGLPVSLDKGCVSNYRQRLKTFRTHLQELLPDDEWQLCQAAADTLREEGLPDEMALEMIESLLREVGVPFIVKEFPILGEQSTLASRFAIAVHMVEGDEAYKQVHDVLMATNGDVNDARLRRIAGDLGLVHQGVCACLLGGCQPGIKRQDT